MAWGLLKGQKRLQVQQQPPQEQPAEARSSTEEQEQEQEQEGVLDESEGRVMRRLFDLATERALERLSFAATTATTTTTTTTAAEMMPPPPLSPPPPPPLTPAGSDCAEGFTTPEAPSPLAEAAAAAAAAAAAEAAVAPSAATAGEEAEPEATQASSAALLEEEEEEEEKERHRAAIRYARLLCHTHDPISNLIHPPSNLPLTTRALEAASSAALALYVELKQQHQQPPQPALSPQDVLREYEAAFARLAPAVPAVAAPQLQAQEQREEREEASEENRREEDREMLAALLERYSEKLVALVERKVKSTGE